MVRMDRDEEEMEPMEEENGAVLGGTAGGPRVGDRWGRGEGGPERSKGGAEAIHAHRGEAGHR